jgi:hypothetical protein
LVVGVLLEGGSISLSGFIRRGREGGREGRERLWEKGEEEGFATLEET